MVFIMEVVLFIMEVEGSIMVEVFTMVVDFITTLIMGGVAAGEEEDGEGLDGAEDSGDQDLVGEVR